MDNTNPELIDRLSSGTNLNNSVRHHSPIPSFHLEDSAQRITNRPVSLMDTPTHHAGQAQIVQVVIKRDDKGYGMKVSGDNPVYVQGVKEGGAAEKAGLHAGDTIIKVNGTNVISSTHTEVVSRIRSFPQAVLTVQKQTGNLRTMGSPSLHTRPLTTTHSTTRITGPQPVDHEKQYQLQLEREQHYRLMIEKEQRYVDLLRSQIASSQDEKKSAELAKTERNLLTLQAMLQNHIRCQNEQSPHSPYLDTPPPLPSTPPNSLPQHMKVPSYIGFGNGSTTPNGNTCSIVVPPPPLPKRNRPVIDAQNNTNLPQHINGKMSVDINSMFLEEEIKLYNNNNNNNNQQVGNLVEPIINRDKKSKSRLRGSKSKSDHLAGISVENTLYSSSSPPPPLPPRLSVNTAGSSDPDAVNSINKQMSYPLVATCATLVNNYSPNHTHHHRTKSSPESITGVLSPSEASAQLISSESMNDLSREDHWDSTATPPGTPPPPYPSPLAGRRLPHSNRSSANTDDGEIPFDVSTETSSPEDSPLRGTGALGRILANSSPIHAANPQTTQQPIISMEDDEISDQEMGQLEDHGPFKSLSLLREHTPHLAVFMNYVLSNCNTNSLLFYLITDLYKEGNAKEMRKWAFEIHSCFLVPGAPLRLSNVDENIAREIDTVLTREFDKEEILRKIFWKARNRAKEELTRQIADFQQKRTAGLGTIFGPTDSVLSDITNDKAKEMKMYENLFLDKLEPYLEEVEKDNYDAKRYYTAAALTTVITRIFGVRPAGHALDRCPTFVNKEKSFRYKFFGYSRKLNVQGHQFVAQPYFTVIACNNCHQIIYGISPQGYQCSVCLINLHRICVKLYDDTCPGPINKKDRGLGKYIRLRHDSNDHRRKQPSHFIQMEKDRRQAEERDNGIELNESGETKSGNNLLSRTGSDRRPDASREDSSKLSEDQDRLNDRHEDEVSHPDSTISLPASTGRRKASTNINRSESVKEQSEKRKQRRNISDPLHNTTNERIELDHHLYSKSGSSSSNSSLSSNSRLSESPSNSVDAVPGVTNSQPTGSEWDSDMEVETDPPDWQSSVPPEDLASLHANEKKRQDIINEFFHTERSHVRNLKVLDIVFMKPLCNKQCLKTEELNLLFPNLPELLEIHTQFNNAMKTKRKESPIISEVGDILIDMFDGHVGEKFQEAAATFCERQQLALEFIKEKRRKDSRFEQILSECEKSNLCRRLPLQGIIPTEMQRLSKYPLLLERLIEIVLKNNNKDNESVQKEINKLKQAHDRSKEILNYVNEAAKIAYNRARLEEIQRHLDTSNFERADPAITSEFKNLDLTRYKLLHEGTLSLHRPNKAPLQVHLVLLEEAVILLQREGERYLLKFFQGGSSTQQSPLSPIIRMSTLLVRTNAASKSSLFLVSTSTHNSQMYDLHARDSAERKMWIKYISDASDTYNQREGKSKRSDPTPDTDETETVQEIPSTKEVSERAEPVIDSSCSTDNDSSLNNYNSQKTNTDIVEETSNKRLSHNDSESSNHSTEIGGGNGAHMKLAAEDWPLIHPSEVQVAESLVLTAESTLTPLEQLRRKDEEVRQALADKEGLVADLLSIPREDFHHIADIASEEIHNDVLANRDCTELVMGAVYQVNQLIGAVNDSLNISDEDTVISTGGRFPSCTSNEIYTSKKTDHIPSVPAYKLQDIASILNTQLTTLLSVVKQSEEEKYQLRKELHRMREQLHEKVSLHGQQSTTPVDTSTVWDSSQSGDLECIEENPTEN